MKTSTTLAPTPSTDPTLPSEAAQTTLSTAPSAAIPDAHPAPEVQHWDADVLIIGGGPAGLSAAIYTARARLSTLVVEGGLPGGQIAQTTEVANYPGFPEPVSGMELAARMTQQAEQFGARIEMDQIGRLTPLPGGGFQAEGWNGHWSARSVILATGATPRRLGIPGENEFWGKGVSTCATCDAPFYAGKDVAVVGGGDAAVEEAMHLAKFARKVTVVHRRGELRAHRSAQEALHATPNIEMRWHAVAEEVVEYSGQVGGLRIQDLQTGERTILGVDGVFVFIGHIPATSYLQDDLSELLDSAGYVKLTSDVHTDFPGIFAAGDAADATYRQLATSVGTGARAAMQAERWIRERAQELASV